MLRVLVVCLGNICRSPIGEELIRYHSKKANFEILVDSAGTKSWHAGSPPDSRSQQVMSQHGLYIGSQKSRGIKSSDFHEFDLILCMDQQNLEDVLAHKQGTAKISLFLEEQDVPDPYYGNPDGFDKVYSMLDRAAGLWVQKWLDPMKS